ncbi:MAG: MerR family transcriptional regulator [Bacteroidetes bacterium]|nr:MerR family transcriptional regulator [Bacteroidota bacterium]
MPYRDKEITKIYYPIGEVAEIFGVNTSLIRFWEKEFDIIKPKKNKKGNRLFTREDVENFRRIFDLVKKQGYTLEGARHKLRETVADLPENDQIYRKLVQIRGKLTDLLDEL